MSSSAGDVSRVYPKMPALILEGVAIQINHLVPAIDHWPKGGAEKQSSHGPFGTVYCTDVKPLSVFSGTKVEEGGHALNL